MNRVVRVEDGWVIRSSANPCMYWTDDPGEGWMKVPLIEAPIYADRDVALAQCKWLRALSEDDDAVPVAARSSTEVKLLEEIEVIVSSSVTEDFTEDEQALLDDLQREIERKGDGAWIECHGERNITAVDLVAKGVLEDDGESGTLFRMRRR